MRPAKSGRLRGRTGYSTRRTQTRPTCLINPPLPTCFIRPFQVIPPLITSVCVSFLFFFSSNTGVLQKPIVSLLLLPPPPASSTPPANTPPVLRLPAHYSPAPDPHANRKRYTGRVLDRVVGRVWWLFTLLGAGSALVGIFNFVLGLGAWGWWRSVKLGGGDSAGVV